MQGVYCLSRPMRLSHATAKAKAGWGSGSGTGSSRGSTPVPPVPPINTSGGPDLSTAPQHGDYLTSPLPRTGNGAGRVSPSSAQTQATSPAAGGDAGQMANAPLPPPERRLSPSTLEYLSQLAAANGGVLNFTPGMALPALPTAPLPPKQHSPDDLHRDHANGFQSAPLSAAPSMQEQQSQYLQQPPQPSPTSTTASSAYPFTPTGGQFPQGSSAPLHRSNSMISPLSPVSTPMGLQPQESYQEGSSMGGASSTDPNNTTVFVGGLSSLISEETLKTFFVPFGEITYVRPCFPLLSLSQSSASC